MDQDLRDLTLQISDLIRTLQSTSGTGATTPTGKNTGTEVVRSVDKMIVALGKLAVAIDGSKKTKIAEEEAIKKFTKAVDKTTEELDKENEARVNSTRTIADETAARVKEAKELEALRNQKIKERGQEVSRLAKDLDYRIKNGGLFNASVLQNRDEMLKLSEGLNSTGATLGILKNSFSEITGAATPAQHGLKFLAAGLEGAVKSLKGFATGLLDGKRGPELSAKAFTDLIKPFTELTSSVGTAAMAVGSIAMLIPGFQGIGVAALAVGGALKLAAKGAETFAEYNERAAKQLQSTFDSFNKLSASGVAIENGIDGTLNLIHTLNMTTAEAEKFNELLGSNTKNLALLGGTAGQGAREFAKVAGSLTRSNLGETFEMMGIDRDEQRQAALQYMSLQARTGQMQLKNTEQLIEESGKFVEELDLAAKLTGTTRKAQQEALEANMAESRYRSALYAAERRGDKDEVERLKKFGDVAKMLRTMGLEEQATGTLQFAASGGAPTTPQALNAMIQLGLSDVFNNPNLTAFEALEKALGYTKEQLNTLTETSKNVGDIGPLLKDIPKSIDAVERMAKIQEEATKQGLTPEEYLKTEQGKAALGDKDLADVVKGNRAMQSATQVMEQGMKQFNAAAIIHKKGSEAFDAAVTKFGDIVGVKVPGVSGPGNVGPGNDSAIGPMERQAKQAHQQQQAKIKNLEEQVLAAEDRAKALEKDAKASRQEKDAARTKANELAAQLAQESRLLRQTQLAEQTARRTERKISAGPLDTKLLESMSSGGITDKRAQANILAQVQAESGGVAKSENLNYSPARLMEMFPKKFATIQEASQVAAGGPEAVGERIYGGRMGNTAAGEGFKYRGRGLIQLTGKDNYKKFGDIIGVDLVQNPDLANDPDIARKLAVAYFQDKQKSGVDLTKSQQVSRAVGHVDIGGSESMKRESLAQKILEQMPKARDGGMFQGPMSGYPAMLHGNEAVIPLENGAVPVTMPALDELVSSNRAVDAQVQVLRNEMGSMMRELVNAIQTMKETGSQERMIQLLESMSRSQQSTATATQRMAQLASN